MAQTRQDMGSGNVKKLLLQLMIPAVVAKTASSGTESSYNAFA